jgi:hypothetical protein
MTTEFAATRRVNPLRVFTARAEARALLAYAGWFEDVGAAIDALFDDAFASGLLDEVGEHVLAAIVVAALAKYEDREDEAAA